MLHHWERRGGDADEDLAYKFAKFNVQLDIPTYTDGEYEVLRDDDWSREETDYLFELCRDFDLRFPIIWDRYEFPGGKARSVEDLKSRYYAVCRNLMELRTPLNQMSTEESLLFNLLNFDKEREVSRKEMAERQFQRTPEQCKEEEMLLAELKRIVMSQERMADERRDLFQRLNYPPTQGNQSISSYTGSQGLAHLRDLMIQSSDKSKKRKSIAAAQTPAETPQSAGGHGSSAANANANANAAQRDNQQNKKAQGRRLSEEDELLYGVSTHEKLSSGLKLRSTMVSATVKGASAQKVQQTFTQLGIASRLNMPTANTVKRYEELQSQIGVLLDARKMLDRIENEARVLRSQLEQKGEKVSR